MFPTAMMKVMRRLSLLAVVVVLEATAMDVHAETNGRSTFDNCACLVSSSHVAKGRRDDGIGVSIIVPGGMRRQFEFQEYGRNPSAPHWHAGSVEIAIGSVHLSHPSEPSYAGPWKHECQLRINGRNADIGSLHYGNHEKLAATFDDPLGEPGDAYWLNVSAHSPRTICRLAARTFWSAVFGVDSWEELRLLRIAQDRRSFDYTNAIGVPLTARVGDFVSREDDRVNRISRTSVTVVRLERDGAGGWREVERSMVVQQSDLRR